jgi:hypothetical protein
MYSDDQRWLDQISMLRRGDEVTVIGQLAKVHPYSLSLEQCELVENE